MPATTSRRYVSETEGLVIEDPLPGEEVRSVRAPPSATFAIVLDRMRQYRPHEAAYTPQVAGSGCISCGDLVPLAGIHGIQGQGIILTGAKA